MPEEGLYQNRLFWYENKQCVLCLVLLLIYIVSMCAGNAVQYEWRSTGVCTNQLLSSTSDTVSLYLESGGSSDCIQVGSNSS